MNGPFRALGVLLILATSVPAAEVYKWTDEQGEVYYGDRAAKPEDAEMVKAAEKKEKVAETPAANQQERLQRQQRLLEVMQQERRANQESKQKTEQQQREQAAKCAQAQRELDSRQSASHLYRRGKDGEKEILSETERAQATAEAEAAVRELCK